MVGTLEEEMEGDLITQYTCMNFQAIKTKFNSYLKYKKHIYTYKHTYKYTHTSYKYASYMHMICTHHICVQWGAA